MQLLVSVRSAAEVPAALMGGADIIDAKEPSRGSLGPVSPATLAEILAQVPDSHAFSVALGDVAAAGEVSDLLGSLDLPSRQAPTFLKLGFAGVTSPEVVRGLLSAAVHFVADRPSPPLVVAVAYADAGRAGTLSPELVCRCAHEAGASGVLVDTYIKDGAGLLQWLTPPELLAWVASVRRAGLLSAVAGGLGEDDVSLLGVASPDVIGFRGAACDGGRSGDLSARRVAGLRRQLKGIAGGRLSSLA
jgi:uncharacterized protein (UPF0264 family)